MSIIELKEKILLNLIFPIADFVMGTCAMKWYKKIKYLETLSKEELEQWQLNQLDLLLNHAYENTVYYKEVFDSLGLKPSDIKTFDDMERLPVLTREIIKERFNDLIPKNINKIKHRYSSTGGSTGEPLRYICDENTWGFVTAMKIHSWQTTGYRYGELFMSLGSSSLFPVNKKSIVHEIYFKLKNTIPLFLSPFLKLSPQKFTILLGANIFISLLKFNFYS
jgi:phenylacetate-CoA ligase